MTPEALAALVKKIRQDEYTWCSDSYEGEPCSFCDSADAHRLVADALVESYELADVLYHALNMMIGPFSDIDEAMRERALSVWRAARSPQPPERLGA